jgi:exportin-7
MAQQQHQQQVVQQQQSAMVQQFERLCSVVYEPDPSLPSDQMTQAVKQAQNQIMKIVQSDTYWHHVQIILTKTTNNYAIAIAANAYRDYMTQKWNHYTKEDRVNVRLFVMRVVHEKMEILNHPSRMALISLITRVSKKGWFDDDRHKEVVGDAKKLLTPDHPKAYCFGIDLLASLVDEMNKPLPGESLTDHRKVAVSFRELALKAIFQVGGWVGGWVGWHGGNRGNNEAATAATAAA